MFKVRGRAPVATISLLNSNSSPDFRISRLRLIWNGIVRRENCQFARLQSKLNQLFGRVTGDHPPAKNHELRSVQVRSGFQSQCRDCRESYPLSTYLRCFSFRNVPS